MAKWYNKVHWCDDQLVNLVNFTEQLIKHFIVAFLLIIIVMQLSIIQQERIMMMIITVHLR